MKLGIGTVQFGMPYGISNKQGQSSSKEVRKILKLASQHHIRVMDTAASYGDSEEVLGRMSLDPCSFDIITKPFKFETPIIEENDVKQLGQVLEQSLRKLRQTSIYGLMFHSADDLLKRGADRLVAEMIKCKEKGLIKKWGVSVYTQKQMDQLLSRYTFDLIQIPLNVLDQRLLQSGYLEKLKYHNLEIHVRSIFLQGLLLMDLKRIPSFFNSIKDLLTKYRLFLQENHITQLQAALGFVNQIQEVDIMLTGIENSQQLQEIITAIKHPVSVDFSKFAINDPLILNPSSWELSSP